MFRFHANVLRTPEDDLTIPDTAIFHRLYGFSNVWYSVPVRASKRLGHCDFVYTR